MKIAAHLNHLLLCLFLGVGGGGQWKKELTCRFGSLVLFHQAWFNMKPSTSLPPLLRTPRRARELKDHSRCLQCFRVCLLFFFFFKPLLLTALLYPAVDFWFLSCKCTSASKKNSRWKRLSATTHISLWDHVFHRILINLVNFHHVGLHKHFNAYCNAPSESRKLIECDKNTVQSMQNTFSATAVLSIPTLHEINCDYNSHG